MCPGFPSSHLDLNRPDRYAGLSPGSVGIPAAPAPLGQPPAPTYFAFVPGMARENAIVPSKRTTKQIRYPTPVTKLAVEKGYITDNHIVECRELLRKSKRIGVQTSVEELLVKQGHLSEERLGELRELDELCDGEGTVFGAYRLAGLLGEGGMGKVYEAVHEFMKRPVAVKIINANATRDNTSSARFFQEIRALAKLDHPHVMTLYDAGKVKRRYYYTMQLLKGKSLGECVERRGPFPENEALSIIRKVARALEHAHRRSVIHRDVKPENILLDDRGDPVVSDFGLVMHHDNDHLTLTHEGLMVGSLHYASPEQADGTRDIDGRSDIYSLGATFYFLLTGRTLYQGSAPHEILVKHLKGGWVSPRRYNRSVSLATVRLLRKMLARKREKRLQTMDDVVTAISRNPAMRSRLLSPFALLWCVCCGFAGGVVVEKLWQPLGRVVGLW